MQSFLGIARWCSIGIVALTVLWPYGVGWSADPAFEVVAGQRQLFMDDVGIERIENLQSTMHTPAKRGAVIRSPDPTKSVQIRTSPKWDPQQKLYKLWTLTIDEMLWESKDGLHWTPGPTPNTRVWLVVRDPHDDDPQRRYKGARLNQGFLASPDGVNWKSLDLPKVHSSDEGNLTYDPETRLFIHTVKRGGPHGRAVSAAISYDFETWDDIGPIFHADELDQVLGRERIRARFADPNLHDPPYNDPRVYNVDIYNMGVSRYESIYIGFPAMFHSTGPVPNYPNTVGFHHVQLTSSRNIKDWTRQGDRQPFIGPSHLGSGAYDLTQILPPSEPIVRDDELWFYYTGLKYRGSFRWEGKYPQGKSIPIPERNWDVSAVCLAVLRRDGFISLDGDHTGGTVTTRPFEAPGNDLFVNVDAREGEFQVELIDSASEVIARSDPVGGDLKSQKVIWQDGRSPQFAGKTVSLRFTVRSGQFYSYWIK